MELNIRLERVSHAEVFPDFKLPTIRSNGKKSHYLVFFLHISMQVQVSYRAVQGGK